MAGYTEGSLAGYPIDAPALGGEAVTPSDTVPLTKTSRFIYVGGAGALAVVTADGSTIVFAAVPAGTTIPIRATKVKSTGTGATGIVNLW